MQFSYQTKRLSLRILTPDYAELIYHFYLQNKNFLEPFEPKRPSNFYSINFHHSNLTCEYRAFLKLSYFRYWIFTKEYPDIPIGCVCFSNILHGAFHSCMLGYKLSEAACHHGYMEEAISTLLPLIMKELHLHRIEAYVQPHNFPSIRLLNRLSFQEEGYLQDFAEINGQWTDHLLYSFINK